MKPLQRNIYFSYAFICYGKIFLNTYRTDNCEISNVELPELLAPHVTKPNVLIRNYGKNHIFEDGK